MKNSIALDLASSSVMDDFVNQKEYQISNVNDFNQTLQYLFVYWIGDSGVDIIFMRGERNLDIKILIPSCRVVSSMYGISFIICAELLLHVKVEMKYYKRNGL